MKNTVTADDLAFACSNEVQQMLAGVGALRLADLVLAMAREIITLREPIDRVDLCRKFITEAALTARQTAVPDDARLQILHEIHAAARDLVLPDWYPLKEDPR